jgi:CRP-like cAMP-binding protein
MSSAGTNELVFRNFLTTVGPSPTVLHVPKGEAVFRQGDPADSIFYIEKGRVKVSVCSHQGKEATLAFQNKGDFIGEECMAASHSLRMVTAAAVLPSTVLKIEIKQMMQALAPDNTLVYLFQTFLLTRCLLMQADLIDHLFNSSEKRLARTLLLLSQLGTGTEATIESTTQETLAEMIGTTRSRVNFFMNRFRRRGYIQYSGRGEAVTVHRSLLNILLQD